MNRVAPLIVLITLLSACLPTTGSEPVAEETAVFPTFTPFTQTPITPDFAATTPAPLCTPPACTANETYYCPGSCPGGCGTVCATVTPPRPDDFGTTPTDWATLPDWLTRNYTSNVPAEQVRAALLDAGWLASPADWQTADFTGDGQPEWTLLLYPPETRSDEYRFPANIWVLNQSGIVYQQLDSPSDMGFSLQLQLLPAADFTGDGRPELVINEESCGAHTCFTGIQVLTAVDGRFTNLVLPVNPEYTAVISVSYADIHYEDFTADGLLDLLVHGGSIGSVGAGITRTFTEVWAWNGTAIQWVETVLDPTTYRHHILYEANEAYTSGNLATARQLYEQAINDATLITPDFIATPEETYAAIVQFATFRLILLDLQEDITNNTADRLASLQQSYPGTAITQAAASLVAGWSGVDNLPALCAAITQTLETYPNPTGGLENLGYGNPALTAVHVCPQG